MTFALLRRVALFVTLGLALATPNVHADFVGSFGVNGNTPAANPTMSLSTATNFTFSNMTSNGNTSGGFSGIGLASGTAFTTTTFTPAALTGFSFSNPTFGTFSQTSMAVVISQGFNGAVLTSEAFRILGTFVGGPVGATPTAASFTISFTQTGGPGTSISSSGTLNIPPTGAVPEPASAVMLGLGLAAIGGVTLRRQRQAK